MKMKCYHITEEDGKIINELPDETWDNLSTDLYNGGFKTGILFSGISLIVGYLGYELVSYVSIIIKQHKSKK